MSVAAEAAVRPQNMTEGNWSAPIQSNDAGHDILSSPRLIRVAVSSVFRRNAVVREMERWRRAHTQFVALATPSPHFVRRRRSRQGGKAVCRYFAIPQR